MRYYYTDFFYQEAHEVLSAFLSNCSFTSLLSPVGDKLYVMIAGSNHFRSGSGIRSLDIVFEPSCFGHRINRSLEERFETSCGCKYG
jgi:hypothetical protein